MSTFFDSNVLVCALDASEGAKHTIADALIAQHISDRSLVISTQVLQETFSVLTRKKRLPADQVLDTLDVFRREKVVPADVASVLRALALCSRHQLSVWDALIVQAALDARCSTLLTEDLQLGMRFGALEVVNPFELAAHEPATAYAAKAPAPRRKR
ncbi:PIN domain-containing protein [Aquincola sp. MAHUQ-54]|uniref:Ribonuclease VapC n=1 Tax=Aquincola agrisoli TaxID=3119538 RepID=A0AAW9QH22_9BURK